MRMVPPLPARVVKAADFDAVIGTSITLRNDAEDIIKRAESAAAQVRTLAEKEREKLTDMIRTISDEELKKFLDIETARSKATAFAEAMEQISAMKRDFDTIRPWLVLVVENSIRRIIGTLDKTDMVARLVAQASREIDPGRCNTLRAGAKAFIDLREAQTRYPRHFEGIIDIQNDNTLEADAIFLECSIGTTEISLDTQIGILLDFLAAQDHKPDAEK